MIRMKGRCSNKTLTVVEKEEMRLIHDMLFGSGAEGLPVEVPEIVSEDAEADDLKEIAKEMMEVSGCRIIPML